MNKGRISSINSPLPVTINQNNGFTGMIPRTAALGHHAHRGDLFHRYLGCIADTATESKCNCQCLHGVMDVLIAISDWPQTSHTFLVLSPVSIAEHCTMARNESVSLA